MGRRRRRPRESAYVWWAAFAVFGVVAFLLGSWRLALLGVLIWCLYEFCFVPTVCGIMTRQGHTCVEPVRGRLFAHSAEHQNLKNDALWRLAGLSNPFHKPVPPPDPNRVTGVLVVSPKIRGRLPQQDRVVLAAAAFGTVATLVGMVVGLLTSS